MAKIEKNYPISNIDEPWNGHSGEQIETFIKDNLKGKVGYTNKVTYLDGTERLVCFATESDYTEWNQKDEDTKWGDAGKKWLITSIELPAVDKQDIYSVKLNVERDPDLLYGSKDVSLNVKGVYTLSPSDGSGEHNVSGTYLIKLRVANNTHNIYKDVTFSANTSDYQNIDISSILSFGENVITLQATCGSVENGTFATSRPIQYTINIVNLSIAPVINTFTTPITNIESGFSLAYIITGDVDKYLEFEFGNYDSDGLFEKVADKQNYQTECNRYLGNNTTNNAISYFSFTDNNLLSLIASNGAHVVRARLYVNDSIKTEWIENQYAVITNSENYESFIILNNVNQTLDNYTEVTFFNWTYYTKSQSTVTFKLVNANDENTVWYSQVYNPDNEQTYSLKTPLNIIGLAERNIAKMYIMDSENKTLANPIRFIINKNEQFEPVTRGLDFDLQPSKYIGLDENDRTIIKSTNGNVIHTDWTGFGWLTDGWQNVLRDLDNSSNNDTLPALHIPAGRSVKIQYNPLSAFAQQNASNVSMTLELDIRTDNIVDETKPIFEICNTDNNGDVSTGIRILPKELYIFTSGKNSRIDQNITWAERKRVHLAINILPNDNGLNLIRIFIDGTIERVIDYDLSNTIGKNDLFMLIGSNYADIDVFGIKCYKSNFNDALRNSDIIRNYIAALPTIEEKSYFKERNNDILSNDGKISFTLAKEKYNVIGLIGALPTFVNQKDEIDGTLYIHKHSSLQSDIDNSGYYYHITDKGQGTTAKNYSDWNQQQKINKKTSETEATTFKKEGTTQEESRKNFYVADGQPLAKKVCGKINYASSMQGHKMGLTRIYTELYKKLLSTSGTIFTSADKPTQLDKYPNARLTVFEEPYLFFHKERENDEWEFKYLMTWGSAKGDKSTFGFDEDVENGTGKMLMLSGSDNVPVLTNFKCPWDNNVYYESEKFFYNGQKSFDVEIGIYDPEDIEGKSGFNANGIYEESLNAIKEFVNYVYYHKLSIAEHSGTVSELANVGNIGYDYWLTSNDPTANAHRYDLFRYSHPDKKWIPVKVSIDDQTSGNLNIFDQYTTFNDNVQPLWNDANYTGSDKDITNELIKKRIKHFRDTANSKICVNDVLYHDCFIFFFAGTDNRAKNTYYYTDPGDLRIRLAQDDLDTVLKTNNSGRNVKPYWVELDTKDDADEYYWAGKNNEFYNLLEKAFPSERTRIMREMLDCMSTLSTTGNAFDYLVSRVLEAQTYFPAVAYNNVTENVYINAKRTGSYNHDNNVDPIQQACGPQYWSEYDWLKDRYMYISSWCEQGDFANKTGLSNAYVFRGAAGTYNFSLTPGKYLYPRIAVGQSNLPPANNNEPGGRVKVAPDELFDYQEFLLSNDSSEVDMYIKGIDYYWDIGNMNVPMNASNQTQLNVSGRMLRHFTFSPKENDSTIYPKGLKTVNVTAVNLEDITIKGLTTVTGDLDLSMCHRLTQIDISDSNFNTIKLPDSESLTTIKLGTRIQKLEIKNQPNLNTVTFQGYANLDNIYIDYGKAKNLNSEAIPQAFYNARKNDTIKPTSISFLNVNWQNVSKDMLMYYAGLEDCVITGTINVNGSFTFNDMLSLYKKWGNIYNSNNALYITFSLSPRDVTDFQISGPTYIKTTGEMSPWTITNVSGNQLPIKDGELDIKWEFDEIQPSGITIIDDKYGIFEIGNNIVDTTFNLKVTIGSVFKTKKVGFWNRLPQLGDFAYYDGTFDEDYDPTKPTVGVVIGVKENEDTCDVDVLANDDISFIDNGNNNASIYYNYSSNGIGFTVGGMYFNFKESDLPGNNEADHFYYGSMAYDSNMLTDIEEFIGSANVTPKFTRIQRTRFTNSAQSENYITTMANKMVDENNKFIVIDNNNLSYCDLSGKYNTEKIIEVANKVIEYFHYNDSEEDEPDIYTQPDNLNSLMQKLARIHDKYYDETAEAIGEYTPESVGMLNSRWRMQRFYPAAYASYLYEPNINNLHDRYKKNNWYLPALGSFVRIMWFYWLSCGQPTADIADEDRFNIELDLRHYSVYVDDKSDEYSGDKVPIFYNIAKKQEGNAGPFKNLKNSGYHSSTISSDTGTWYTFFRKPTSITWGTLQWCEAQRVRPMTTFTFNK